MTESLFIMVPVADGIHKAEELIKRAVDGTVPVYHHAQEPRGRVRVGRQ